MKEYLVKLTRWTRGQSSRAIEFLGLVTEIQSKDEKGNPLFTKPRAKKDGSPAEEPKPIMEDVNPDTLPDSATIFSGISELLGNVEGKIRLALAKTYNAIAMSLEAERTAEIVVDVLSPEFEKLGITDKNDQANLRRQVSAAYNYRVENGKIAKDQTADQMAETKIKLLHVIID